MKIKRIVASDMRTALRKVREEHGPDAVILSNRKIDGGIELISAIDYDEAAVQQTLQKSQGHSIGKPGAAIGARPKRQEHTLRSMPKATPQSPVVMPVAQVAKPVVQKVAEPVFEERVDFGEEALSKIEWSPDPALQQMRHEIQALRGLFENQLSVMQWQQKSTLHPVQVEVLRRLNQMGLGHDVARKVTDMATDIADPARAWNKAKRILAQNLPSADDAILQLGGIVALVGPTGVGKTTTVAKLAARYALTYGADKVALISTDTFRIGAHEQLKNFGKIIGVPVYQANHADELRKTVQGLSSKHLVLIDTAGMSQRDMRLTKQFGEMMGSGLDIQNYLVLSANTQLTSLSESVKAFRQIPLSGTIVTKLDECAGLGGVLTVALRHKLPIAYCGNGQRVPEDLSIADANHLIEQAIALAENTPPADDDILALEYAELNIKMS